MRGELNIPALSRFGKSISASLHHQNGSSRDDNDSNPYENRSSNSGLNRRNSVFGLPSSGLSSRLSKPSLSSINNSNNSSSNTGGNVLPNPALTPVRNMSNKPPLTWSPSSANLFGTSKVTSIIGNNVSDVVPPVIKKALASSHGGGMSLSIVLLEPVLYLAGFDLNECQIENPALLRGALVLRVAKPANIRGISLSFTGRSRTEWPEGIPVKGHDTYEDKVIISHNWKFYEPTMKDADAPQHGADVARLVGEQLPLPSSAAASLRGYSVFAPGEYTYNFDLAIPNCFPESVEAKMGWVRYFLEATVERFGTFKSNLNGRTPVQLVRTPSPASLSSSELINISRDWDERLHYELQVSGKSFRLGEVVPITFRFLLLDKVRLYKLSISVVESSEYWCRSRKFHRVDPKRRVLLAERSAKHQNTDNLFETPDEGDGLSSAVFNFNVALPTCLVKERDRLTFDTTYKYIKVRHRLKALLVLSIENTENPEKRKYFEINIETPVRILSCRCVKDSTLLPPYESSSQGDNQVLLPCPCRLATTHVEPTEVTAFTTQSVLASSAPSAGRPAAAQISRPAQLFRIPSTNPPPFDGDVCPPACNTPPPNYDELFDVLSSISIQDCETDRANDDTILNNRVRRSGTIREEAPHRSLSRTVSRSFEIPR
ncbi:putative arrestin-related trafficking adapter C2D10.04 [Schizosaccharomyces pombe]|uniref:Putative arrestin-related trafficking adapter aly2 n=1 Tax=Schizosaccharomyces pombe (strain 972 / ATCC 24843) TaxID=284812 RepID=ALY2_SCHPO|nr:arrestin Aly1-like protein [Schizosaccharomyces pombe]O74798.1 RecName: Full=Putative arrestin-related trafficking adapter C2D10.04 [Schizosaccharomyces pombe 972h-]CAA21162.1 arrestin Aly1 related, implicated in endocytosis [Schizosaccharomyces pombe]|eukprot:NP_596223.1 arrestin Aly1-like protein [Schizosaccharomyces pombe]